LSNIIATIFSISVYASSLIAVDVFLRLRDISKSETNSEVVEADGFLRSCWAYSHPLPISSSGFFNYFSGFLDHAWMVAVHGGYIFRFGAFYRLLSNS
jgi:hypothetical protein